MPDLEFEYGPTQTEFILCNDHIVQLNGPMGEGKTFAGVGACIYHAQRCRRNIEGALVRDTFQNIKTSTLKDFKEYLGGLLDVTDGGKHVTIKCEPQVDLDLFGIDDEASISKLQGPQYAIIWLEEPAPIYEKANAGLPREVFNLAVARAARLRNTVPRVQITQNPADEEHWTSLMSEEPDGEYARYEDPVTGEVSIITKRTFNIPRGENRFLSGIARAANIAAFKDDDAKFTRYVLGQTATVYRGKQVTPKYNPEIHFSRSILPVERGQLIQMWDSYQHPTCVLAQMNRHGQLVFHNVCYGEGLGPEELISEQVRPMLATPKYRDKVLEWRIIGDQTMRTPDQSSVRRVTSKIIETEFDARFEPGPARWTTIRESLGRAFSRLVGPGLPALIVSRSAVRLHRAFRGGWHYKTDNNGNVMGDKPVKDQHSHPGDAAANGIAVLMPYVPVKEPKGIPKAQQEKLAKSYRGGNYSHRGRATTTAMM